MTIGRNSYHDVLKWGAIFAADLAGVSQFSPMDGEQKASCYAKVFDADVFLSFSSFNAVDSEGFEKYNQLVGDIYWVPFIK